MKMASKLAVALWQLGYFVDGDHATRAVGFSATRRKLRYARLLVETAVDRGSLPHPLDALLSAV
jgi:hypothetical protein